MGRPKAIYKTKVYMIRLGKKERKYHGADFLQMYDNGQFPRQTEFYNDLTGRWEPVSRLAAIMRGKGSPPPVGLILLFLLITAAAAGGIWFLMQLG